MAPDEILFHRQGASLVQGVVGDCLEPPSHPEMISPDERVKVKQEIEALLNKYFDEDIETRQAKITEIEQRVAKLKEQLQKRLTAKSELSQLQMKLFENEAAGLGFFGAPKATNRGMGMYGGEGEGRNFSDPIPAPQPQPQTVDLFHSPWVGIARDFFATMDRLVDRSYPRVTRSRNRFPQGSCGPCPAWS